MFSILLLSLMFKAFYSFVIYFLSQTPRIRNHKHTLAPSSSRSFQAGGGDKEQKMLRGRLAIFFLLASVLCLWKLCTRNSDLTCTRMSTWKIFQFSFRSTVCLAKLCKLYECVFNFYSK